MRLGLWSNSKQYVALLGWMHVLYIHVQHSTNCMSLNLARFVSMLNAASSGRLLLLEIRKLKNKL